MLLTILAIIVIVLVFQVAYITNFQDNQYRKNSDELVIDLSDHCTNNYSRNVYLTYGVGRTDATVINLRGPFSSKRNCSIIVVGAYSDNKQCKHQSCRLIAVTEFFNYNLSNTPCMSILGGISIISEEKNISNVCADINKDSNQKNNFSYQTLTNIIKKDQFTLNINITNFSGIIKITVTSARYIGKNGSCIRPSETNCVLGRKKLCIDKFLMCDGNANCGSLGKYDEYCDHELNYGDNMIGPVLYGFILLAILLVFFIQLLRACVPTVADHFFIFNENDDNKFVLASQSLPPLHSEQDEFFNQDEREIIKRMGFKEDP